MIQAVRLSAMPDSAVARQGGRIVGVYGMEPPGGSKMTPEHQQQMAKAMAIAGPGVMALAGEMLAGFARHAPGGEHWKLGPVAVHPDLQGSGIGSVMVRHFCARADALGASSSLDTDRLRNVRFYERFGFEVVVEGEVIGVPMWFMVRPTQREVPDA
jgi:GNAT superfamily N-acetyltransferase